MTMMMMMMPRISASMSMNQASGRNVPYLLAKTKAERYETMEEGDAARPQYDKAHVHERLA
jgi:hypothetical protein